jgi:hypothetical protein
VREAWQEYYGPEEGRAALELLVTITGDTGPGKGPCCVLLSKLLTHGRRGGRLSSLESGAHPLLCPRACVLTSLVSRCCTPAPTRVRERSSFSPSPPRCSRRHWEALLSLRELLVLNPCIDLERRRKSKKCEFMREGNKATASREPTAGGRVVQRSALSRVTGGDQSSVLKAYPSSAPSAGCNTKCLLVPRAQAPELLISLTRNKHGTRAHTPLARHLLDTLTMQLFYGRLCSRGKPQPVM